MRAEGNRAVFWNFPHYHFTYQTCWDGCSYWPAWLRGFSSEAASLYGMFVFSTVVSPVRWTLLELSAIRYPSLWGHLIDLTNIRNEIGNCFRPKRTADLQTFFYPQLVLWNNYVNHCRDSHPSNPVQWSRPSAAPLAVGGITSPVTKITASTAFATDSAEVVQSPACCFAIWWFVEAPGSFLQG